MAELKNKGAGPLTSRPKTPALRPGKVCIDYPVSEGMLVLFLAATPTTQRLSKSPRATRIEAVLL